MRIKNNNRYQNIINRTRKFVKKYMNDLKDISHDYKHINYVINLALKIAKYEKINNKRDLFHIKMGALLHDIGDTKYYKGNQYNYIKEYLNKIKCLNKYDKNEILKISSNISLSKDNNINYNKKKIKLYIVQDADRINSLGSIGIMRYISYNLINKKENSFDEIINNIIKRTNKIKKFIRTNSGKEIAKKHFKLINSFINNYKNFK